MNSKKCKDCRKDIKLYEKMYYCCDPADKFCQTCRKNPCDDCSKKRNHKHELVKCRTCLNANTTDDCYLSFKTSEYYCPKCILEAYDKASSNRVMLSKLVSFPKNQIQLFLENYCAKCKRRINPSKFEEYQKGKKLCEKCGGIRIGKKKFQKCNLCEKIVEKEHIGVKQGDFLICKFCANDSFLEERNIKIQKEMRESQKMPSDAALARDEPKRILKKNSKNQDQPDIKKNMKKQEIKVHFNYENREDRNSKQIVDKQKRKSYEQKEVEKEEEKKQENGQKKEEEKIQEKAEQKIKEQKKQQKKSSKISEKNESKKVEKKSEKKEEKKQQKIMKEMQMEERIMKRVSSTKLLQNVQIPIFQQSPEEMITCSICEFEIESMFSISGTNTQNIVCRGCYTLQNNKSIGFNSKLEKQSKNQRRNLHLTVEKHGMKDFNMSKYDESSKKKSAFQDDYLGILTAPKIEKTTIKKQNIFLDKNCYFCNLLKRPCSRHMAV